MGRTTVYNNIVSESLWNEVLKDNKDLLKEFIEYKNNTNKADKTVYQYEQMLRIFFVWNLKSNGNKFFIDLKKREAIKFIGYLMNDLKSSSNRITMFKSVLSSFANFIENIYDEDYPNYKNIYKSMDVGVKQTIREKTILSDEQITSVLDELVARKKYQAACAFSLALGSGARKSELTRFKAEYFKDEYIICDSLYETPEEIKTKGRSKQGKMLKKYTIVSIFKPYFELWMNERKEKGIESEWLFVGKSKGEYVQAGVDTFNNWAELISKILGEPFYFHSTRHYWTTDLKRKGLPDDVIQKLQGWSSSEMLNLYNDDHGKVDFSKYFSKEGIKKVEAKGLGDI